MGQLARLPTRGNLAKTALGIIISTSGTNGLRTPRWREPDSITFGETEQTELVNVWSMTIGGRHRSGRLADRARSS
jgi:hypothetical protein